MSSLCDLKNILFKRTDFALCDCESQSKCDLKKSAVDSLFSFCGIVAGIGCFFVFLFCYLHTLKTNKLIGPELDTNLFVISSLYLLLIGCVVLVLNIKTVNRIPDLYFLIIVCGIDIYVCYLVSDFLNAGFPTQSDAGLYHQEAKNAISYSTWSEFVARWDYLRFRRSLFSFFIPYQLFGVTTGALKVGNTIMHLLLGCNIYFICKKVFNSKQAAQFGILLYFLIPTSYFSINSTPHDLWGASYLSFCLLFFIMLSDGRIIDYVANIASFKEKTQIRSLLLIVYLYLGYFVFAFFMSMSRGPDMLYCVFIFVAIYLSTIFLKQCMRRTLTGRKKYITLAVIFLFAVVAPYITASKFFTPYTNPGLSGWHYKAFAFSPNIDAYGDHIPYIKFSHAPGDDYYQAMCIATAAHATKSLYAFWISKSTRLFSLNDTYKMVKDSNGDIIQKAYDFQDKLMPVFCTILWTFVLIGFFYLVFIRRLLDYRLGFAYALSLFLLGTLTFGEGQPNYLQSMYPFIVILETEGLLFLLNKSDSVSSSAKEGMVLSGKFCIPAFFLLFAFFILSFLFIPPCFGILLKDKDFVDLSKPELSSRIQFSDDMTNFIKRKGNSLWTYIPLPSHKDETMIAEWSIPDYEHAAIRGFLEITELDMDSYEISLSAGDTALTIPPRQNWKIENLIRSPRRKPMYSIYINQSVDNTNSKLTLKITCKDDLKEVKSSFDRMLCVHSFQIMKQ